MLIKRLKLFTRADKVIYEGSKKILNDIVNNRESFRTLRNSLSARDMVNIEKFAQCIENPANYKNGKIDIPESVYETFKKTGYFKDKEGKDVTLEQLNKGLNKHFNFENYNKDLTKYLSTPEGRKKFKPTFESNPISYDAGNKPINTLDDFESILDKAGSKSPKELRELYGKDLEASNTDYIPNLNSDGDSFLMSFPNKLKKKAEKIYHRLHGNKTKSAPGIFEHELGHSHSQKTVAKNIRYGDPHFALRNLAEEIQASARGMSRAKSKGASSEYIHSADENLSKALGTYARSEGTNALRPNSILDFMRKNEKKNESSLTPIVIGGTAIGGGITGGSLYLMKKDKDKDKEKKK